MMAEKSDDHLAVTVMWSDTLTNALACLNTEAEVNAVRM